MNVDLELICNSEPEILDKGLVYCRLSLKDVNGTSIREESHNLLPHIDTQDLEDELESRSDYATSINEDRIEELEAEVENLETEVGDLQSEVAELEEKLEGFKEES